MSEMREAEFGVQQVEEKAGATGYRIIATGHFPAPPPAMWDENATIEPEFFPGDVGISARLELDFTRFAKPKAAISYYGTIFRVTIEAVSVPVDKDPASPTYGQLVDRSNGGLQRPIGRRT